MIDDKIEVESCKSVIFKSWKHMHFFNREVQEKCETYNNCLFESSEDTQEISDHEKQPEFCRSVILID
jgi:hypothetical protein